MKPTTARLKLEQLGARILPSANPALGSPGRQDGATHTAGLTTPSVPAPTKTFPGLDGTVRGTLKQFQSLPADMGFRFALDGAGKLGGLDTFSVKGVLHGTGFVAKGQATGLLTLTNKHGSITVKLLGPEQAGFAALPSHFHFTVVAGAGAYAKVHDAGDVKVTFETHGGAAENVRLTFA